MGTPFQHSEGSRQLFKARGGNISPMISVRLVRFLFVDGDHSRAGVEADITLFFPLLTPGSIVVFDDFSEEAIGLVNEADALLARQPTSKAFNYPNTLVLVLNQGCSRYKNLNNHRRYPQGNVGSLIPLLSNPFYVSKSTRLLRRSSMCSL